MSEHKAKITWQRTTDDFRYENYNRDHEWKFEGGVHVPASAAVAYLGSPHHVDPEEAFVASLSSCHMLTFLAIAAKKRLTVDSYEDAAIGYMNKNENGKLAITKVELRPKITFSGDKHPTPEQIQKMHHSSHKECFIANSVTTEVLVVK
jgi:organic hydroperoxide reductase OsmC/OhrA